MGILRCLRYLVYFKACCCSSDEARIQQKIKSQLLHWFTCKPLLVFFFFFFSFNIHTWHNITSRLNMPTPSEKALISRFMCTGEITANGWLKCGGYKKKKNKNHTIIPYTSMTQVQLIDLFIGTICGKWWTKVIPNIYSRFGGDNLHRELWM